ncbi:uncharacterized protein EDB91DRAFT_1119076 [Suillus paluster]|uniref:uncharacterized protein n=1 Tax=Suillus paluster TaxID=48578 RepID=UPI001B878848|nr:uncharacterized protein EDB91DRAFT_1119076 [Suillus paluster]KAG1745857.1 hypothetical protein EDB91DRAFT_1119076 [Suillus paluster]
MLLCRRLLPRVYTPIRVYAQQVIGSQIHGKALSRSRLANVTVHNALPEAVELAPMLHRKYAIEKELLERVTCISTWLPPRVSKKSPQVEKMVEALPDPFAAYAELRRQDRALAASLPLPILVALSEKATKHGLSTIVDSIAADVLEELITTSNRQLRVATALLSATHRDSPILGKQKIHSLLVILHQLDALSELSTANVSTIVKRIVDNSGIDPYDAKIADILLPIFHQSLRKHSAPKGTKSMSYRPPGDVAIAFGLIHKLIAFDRDRHALHLFQTLTETCHIPVEAFTEVHHMFAKDENFAFVIRSTLVRACLHWGWYHRALDIVATAIRTRVCADVAVTELALSTLHLTLHNASPGHFKHCAWLICHLIKSAGNVVVPDSMVRLFYDKAMQLQDGPSAEVFYRDTQSPTVIRRIKYPLPRGRSLTWLMNHLTITSRNVHLARTLAKQVIDEMEPIPLQDRAHFITLTASHGFATSARTLWERYSVGRDRGVVLGNASLMLRMVGIFSKLIFRTKTKIDEPTPSQDEAAQSTALTLEEQQKQLDHLLQFTERVIADFRMSKGSLEETSHYDLSTLARAYITLGRVSEGLDMLKVLLQRYEIPDIYDINIAISAMAELHPRKAVSIMKKMVERGIRPDAVTFGTIIHHAILHGELRLAGYLIGRAKELGCEELSAKTTASLLRASVNVDGAPKSILKDNLQRAWEIIQSGDISSVVHTPNTGKYCIFASLRLGDPVMAFRFWEMLVKGKTEWGDRKQVFQRRLIADMIQRHCQEGALSRNRGRQMLAQLEERRVL